MNAARARWGTLLVLAVGLAFIACRGTAPADEVHGNGRIEGDDVRVAAEIPGRIERLTVDEADRVEAGQLLAELSSDEIRARVDATAAQVRAAAAAVAAAEASVETLEHHAETARTDYRRLQALHEAGAIAGRELDRAENELEEARGQLALAETGLREARARLEAAEAAETAARTRLADARVTAPLDGVVLLRLVEAGEVV